MAFLRIISIALLTAILFSCGGPSPQAAAIPESAAVPAEDPMEIQPNEELRRQIKIGAPAMAQITEKLLVSAMVTADETRIARVSSPVNGRIVEMEVVEGETVKRGQVLAIIRSTELSNSQLEFLKAYSQRQLAERAVERAKRLVEADVLGTAELQRREAELTQAVAEVASARDELRVLGVPEDSLVRLEKTRTINSVTQVVATIDGIVLDRPVTPGQVIQSADTVMVLADLTNAWLVADVPESNAGNLRVGMDVEAEISARPGEAIHGKLSFVSARVDPETRTVRARMNLPNPNGRYKPAMLATMVLRERSPKQLTVPSQAVIREENSDYLLVQIAPDKFLLRPVSVGPETDGLRVVTSGAGLNDKIVVEGAFHLNNERRRRALRGSDGE